MRKLLLILLFAGCVTQKTATKYFNKHDEVASGYCATKYPVKVGEPKMSEEDWSDTSDYCPTCLTAFADTTRPHCLIGDLVSHAVILTRIINHYHIERDSIPYIDSALAHNLRLQLGNALQTNTALQNTMIANNKAANAKYDALSKSKKMWMWIAIAACGGFLGLKGIWWLIKRII